MRGNGLWRRNPELTGFRSMAGGPALPIGDWFEGCPEARAAGAPTSVVALYANSPTTAPGTGRMTDAAGWMPYLDWPSLYEGGTPLIPLPAPAQLGSLSIKAEWMNPTGSHKDRMSPLVVARAAELGVPGVICASSGNAGISLAAYAARGGLRCRVVITPAVPDGVRRALLAHGAELVGAADGLARWELMRRLVREEGWYPATNHSLPAVGSNPWGVEGYRSLAFELAAAMPAGLDAIILPTARGDLAWGVAAGFMALREAGFWSTAIPRIVAVEPFPRLSAVLAGGARITDHFEGTTRQASTAGATATDQALRAVRDSGGTALTIDDPAAEAGQATLAARHGLFLERCAAAPFAALRTLVESGWLQAGARVVLVATAAGQRDAEWAPPPALEIAA
jgi:threonine synthase